MIASFASWALRRMRPGSKGRAILTAAILDSIDAVPLRSMIAIDEHRRVLVRGEPLNPEEFIQLRESARAILNNRATRLIRDQVRFVAINDGYLKSIDPETQIFYKAALWYAQSEKELLQELAGTQDPTLSED